MADKCTECNGTGTALRDTPAGKELLHCRACIVATIPVKVKYLSAEAKAYALHLGWTEEDEVDIEYVAALSHGLTYTIKADE